MHRFLRRHFLEESGYFTHFILPVFLLLTSVLSCFGQNSIVDLYRELPLKYLSNYRYEIVSRDGEWYSYSIANYEFSITSDIQTGYLLIEDPGGSGESFSQELKIFNLANGNFLLAVNIRYFDGVGTDGSLVFYNYADGKFTEWYTDEMKSGLPELTYQNFISEDFIISDEIQEEDASRCIQILFHLPETGTTIIAKADDSRLFYKIDATEKGKDKKFYNSLLKNIKYNEIELLFDSNTGQFTVGRKISK